MSPVTIQAYLEELEKIAEGRRPSVVVGAEVNPRVLAAFNDEVEKIAFIGGLIRSSLPRLRGAANSIKRVGSSAGRTGRSAYNSGMSALGHSMAGGGGRAVSGAGSAAMYGPGASLAAAAAPAVGAVARKATARLGRVIARGRPRRPGSPINLNRSRYALGRNLQRKSGNVGAWAENLTSAM